MAERLHFNSSMAYESMLAAEHLARYWLLREACQGQRVLDVACGEGYGSSLLRAWGASEVVGVDLSHEAIANAKARFGATGISYRVGDACNLETVLAQGEQFDLIACFETLEHVPDVPGLLHGIRMHLAPGGTIVISCPNDPEIASEHPNEFHLQTYTFEQFQTAATQVLGAAVQWQLGTPIIGFGIVDTTDHWAQGQNQQLTNMLEGADAAAGRFLPAQAGHEVAPRAAYFYLGVWGTPLQRTMVAAPIAHRAYVEPWNNWVAAREENERLLASQAQTALAVVRDEIIVCKRQLAVERSARVQIAAKLYERDHQYQQRLFELDQRHQQALSERDAMAAQCHRTQEQWTAAEAEKNSLNMRLHVLTSSRAHRAVVRYYRLYEHPATRWFMRPMRRMAAWFWRLIKSK